MANKVASLALLAVLLVAALLSEALTATDAVTCSPVQLSPCAPAIMSNKQPSGACCARLRQQKPCLCGYYRNPSLKKYINSPGARRVASTCRVHVRC